ncbi:MAG: hypothetical protein PHV17_03490, partial [Candidatus Omnitrophica bacterium]|nr:hypothetical protein [Candidatus Omnitrophota bacterium]
ITVDGDSLAKRLLKSAERIPQASFGEGYWVDHWRYNLDLLESYLDYYPDKLSDLFTNKKFMFWDDDVLVKPRAERYCLRREKVYQGESVEHDSEKKSVLAKRTKSKNFLRTKTGKIYYTNLVEKLLTLILNKSATLDPDGIGVEMEAGKPGWCDSLNGLPALFGSSLCETFAVKRTALFLRDALTKLSELGETSVILSVEVNQFLKDLTRLLSGVSSTAKNKDFIWWDKSNAVKETFRKNTFFHLSGEEEAVELKTVISFLDKLIVKLNAGIKKGKDKKSGVYNTYFTYTVTDFRQSQSAIYPKSFKRHALPLFLEAPVSALSVEKNKSDYNAVKRSVLFDKTLKMYRLNASLKSEPLEIGRSRVFVPGWLENESIWLHMEYKYLLETLKVGLYDDFYEDFFTACVCFFDPARYGRNVLENSSFIASSAYPDKTFWGKGFVARLSGATAEFLNIWILLCLGKKPFFIDTNRGLCFKVEPVLKASLFTTKKSTVFVDGKAVVLEKNTFCYKLFSRTLVVYHNPNRRDTFFSKSKTTPAAIERIVLTVDGKKQTVNASVISSPLSYRVRRAEVERIDVYFK